MDSTLDNRLTVLRDVLLEERALKKQHQREVSGFIWVGAGARGAQGSCRRLSCITDTPIKLS